MTIISACFENEINNAWKCTLNSSMLYRCNGWKVRKLPCCTVLNILRAQYFSDLKIFLASKLISWLTKIGYPSSKIIYFTRHSWSYSNVKYKNSWIHLLNYLLNCCPLVLVQNTAYTFDLSKLLCPSHQVESKHSEEIKKMSDRLEIGESQGQEERVVSYQIWEQEKQWWWGGEVWENHTVLKLNESWEGWVKYWCHALD